MSHLFLDRSLLHFKYKYRTIADVLVPVLQFVEKRTRDEADLLLSGGILLDMYRRHGQSVLAVLGAPSFLSLFHLFGVVHTKIIPPGVQSAVMRDGWWRLAAAASIAAGAWAAFYILTGTCSRCTALRVACARMPAGGAVNEHAVVGGWALRALIGGRPACAGGSRVGVWVVHWGHRAIMQTQRVYC